MMTNKPEHSLDPFFYIFIVMLCAFIYELYSRSYSFWAFRSFLLRIRCVCVCMLFFSVAWIHDAHSISSEFPPGIGAKLKWQNILRKMEMNRWSNKKKRKSERKRKGEREWKKTYPVVVISLVFSFKLKSLHTQKHCNKYTWHVCSICDTVISINCVLWSTTHAKQ